MKSKSIVGAIAAVALFASSALAADTASVSPLPPGKAAGTKEAAMLTPGWMVIIAAVAVGTFVAIAATGGFNSSNSASGTGS